MMCCSWSSPGPGYCGQMMSIMGAGWLPCTTSMMWSVLDRSNLEQETASDGEVTRRTRANQEKKSKRRGDVSKKKKIELMKAGAW